MLDRCIQGDCRDVMRTLIDGGVQVQCIVTSPPYWGLRDYGTAGQIGLEPTFNEFLDTMIDVFDLCRQLLASDGTLWLNMGDCIREKEIIGQPWKLAFALQEAGWYLRQDIIWHKPNPMPESVRDRCTKAHEYLFLLTKSPRYYFDQSAIREPAISQSSCQKSPDGWATHSGSHGSFHKDGREKGIRKPRGVSFGHGTDAEKRGRGRVVANSFSRQTKESAGDHGQKPQHRPDRKPIDYSGVRNKRSVWTIPTQSFSGAHFATFPEELVEPCILAGSRVGDIVFDPFMGSGTVAQVAQRLGRRWLGAELNPEYIKLQADRTRQLGMALEIS